MTVEIAHGETATVSIKAAQPSLPLLLPLEDSIPNECGLSSRGMMQLTVMADGHNEMQ